MPVEATTRVKYRTPLRAAQRDLTRGRILEAARSLFFARHFDTVTMDEIALAAGLRRSTVYLHFRDKDAVLLEVIAEYGGKARSMLSRLPGPRPDLEAVRQWVGKVARFVAKEHAPLSIIVEMRRKHGFAEVLEALTNDLLESLGARNPPFCGTGGASADPLRRGRALMLLDGLTYACEVHVEDPAGADAKALMQIVAADFHAFLSAPAAD